MLEWKFGQCIKFIDLKWNGLLGIFLVAYKISSVCEMQWLYISGINYYFSIFLKDISYTHLGWIKNVVKKSNNVEYYYILK